MAYDFGNLKFPSINSFVESIQIDEDSFRNYLLADYQYEILLERVKEFEKELDDNHEIAIKLASFGQNVTLNVTSIGYSNPSLIHFYGYVNNQYAELVQHVSQLNFLLISVKKQDESKPANRIGFIQD